MTSKMKKVLLVFNKSYLNNVLLELGSLGFCQLTQTRKELEVKTTSDDLYGEFNDIYTNVLRLLERFDMRNIKLDKSIEEYNEISFKKENLASYLSEVKEKVEEITRALINLEETEHIIENELIKREEITKKTSSKASDDLFEMNKRKEELIRSFNEITMKYYARLSKYSLELSEIITFLGASLKTGGSNLVAVIETWVPEEKLQNFEEAMRKVTNDSFFMKQEQISSEYAPSDIRYGKILKPFGTLLKQYGTPNVDEVDPSPLLIITFPIMFGLMFGDIGQGICLAIAAGIFALKTKRTIAKILFYCGLGAILGGFLYGELFGFEMESLIGFPPLIGFLFSPLTQVQLFPVFNYGGLIENLIFLIKFSLFVGFIVITLGYILQFVNNYKKFKKIDAWLVSLPAALFIIGFATVFFSFGLDLMSWFYPQPELLYLPPIMLIILPLIILLVSKPIVTTIKPSKDAKRSSIGHVIFESFLHTWETFLSFLSNSVSFIRIFAFLLIHWVLNFVLITIAMLFVFNLIAFGVILILGNIAIIILEAIFVSIQTLRLHFNEWFTKFYQGRGTEYKPFILKLTNKKNLT